MTRFALFFVGLAAVLEAEGAARADSEVRVFVIAPTTVVDAELRRIALDLGITRDSSGVPIRLERDAYAWALDDEDSDPAPALRVLEEIEARLVDARRLAQAFREADALARLSEARGLADRALALRGIVPWLAEVEVATAVVADQAAMPALAEQALVRAATIDPDRVLRAAEARPALVELAQRVVERVAVGPRGEFAVDCGEPTCSVELDGQAISDPSSVRASVGQHVLVIRARGHAPFARRIDVLEGTRPPLRIALARRSALALAERISARVEHLGYTDLRAELRDAPAERTVLLVRVGAGGRRAAFACSKHGCTAPSTYLRAARLGVHSRDDAGWQRAVRWAETLPVAPSESPAWWERIETWGVVGATVLAVGLSVAATVSVEPARRRAIVVEPGDFAL